MPMAARRRADARTRHVNYAPPNGQSRTGRLSSNIGSFALFDHGDVMSFVTPAIREGEADLYNAVDDVRVSRDQLNEPYWVARTNPEKM